jgi:ribose transport system substrate-binding protein
MRARTRTTSIAKWMLIAAIGAVAMLSVASCGGGDDSGGSGSSSSSQGGQSNAYFKNQLATLFKGTHEAIPTKAPTPQPGKKIWLISCGQAYTTCSIVMGAAGDAAKELGWSSRVFDSKGDPTVAATGIRQAIAAKADGIYIYYMDCGALKQPLQEAKQAGIPVVASESFDCDHTNPSAPKLYTYIVQYVQGTTEAWCRGYGAAAADYVIAKVGTKANSLLFQDDTTACGKPLAEGFANEFKKCADCKFQEVLFPITAIGVDLQSRAEQALLKNPDVNSIAVEYDAILVSGVGAAAKASGRKLLVLGGEGGPAAMEAVRNGTADGGIGDANDWGAWSAMDALNRIFHGEKPLPSGVGLQAYDKDHAVPSAKNETFQVNVDFKAAYRKAWGLD